MARPRPLGWYPGWRFGACEFDRSPLYWMRFLLWSKFNISRKALAFPIAWYDGLRVVVHLGNDSSLCVYVAGTYEPNEFALHARVLRPGMVYLDVGANDGLYSLFASRLVGPTGRVLAFEPSDRELGRLEANLRLNGIQNVRALKAAAGDRSGVATLRVAGFGHEGHNTLGAFAYDTEQQNLEEVPVVTLDDSVRAERIEHVDMIKIDAEGAELAVLKGAATILRTHRPLIQFEVLEAALAHQDSTGDDVCEWLRSFGYRFYVFGRSGRPEAVTRIESDATNVVAVHADACDTLDGVLRRP